MKTTLCIVLGMLVAGAARADVNMSIAKQQARRAATPGGQAAGPQGPSAAPPAPTDPELIATRQNISNLRADFAAICAAAEAASAGDQRIPLLNHLSAAALGTKASTASVRKMAGDLIKALASQKASAEQVEKLGVAVHAFFNGGHISAAQQTALLKQVNEVLSELHVAAEDADKISEDLKTVAKETR